MPALSHVLFPTTFNHISSYFIVYIVYIIIFQKFFFPFFLAFFCLALFCLILSCFVLCTCVFQGSQEDQLLLMRLP